MTDDAIPRFSGLTLDDVQRYAAKYIWWKSPPEAARYPLRVIAQVLDIGTFEDCFGLLERVGEEPLREVLRHAQAGWFRPRSWYFWHHKLGMAELGKVPDLPGRRFL
ncbi:MAG: hypothetical protein EPN41_03425 [Candidimonas sp.]|nr:MAG: hypothetical protein EPN41_03425 [Candidimonas sp.]